MANELSGQGKTAMGRTIVVNATWDPEESLWAKLPGIIQDLLQDETDGQEVEIPVQLITHSTENVRVRSRVA